VLAGLLVARILLARWRHRQLHRYSQLVTITPTTRSDGRRRADLLGHPRRTAAALPLAAARLRHGAHRVRIPVDRPAADHRSVAARHRTRLRGSRGRPSRLARRLNHHHPRFPPLPADAVHEGGGSCRYPRRWPAASTSVNVAR
jgi:hypothetical protein